MLESLFTFLFEYRRIVFEQGEFRLAPLPGSYAALLLAAALAVAAVIGYRRAARPRGGTPLGLLAIRLALLAVVAFCLLRPVLVVKTAVPQQNYLAVLLDDSRSMQIADYRPDGGTPLPRGEFVRRKLADPQAALLRRLSEKFVVRTFRFSSSAARLASPDELSFGGTETRLAAALDGARQELSGLPLAGMVLVTDGADTADAALGDALLGLKAASLPVFTVGVGQDRLARDIQVDRVASPRQALKGTSLLIDVTLRQTGYAGQTVALDVEDEGRNVGTEEVKLPADGQPASARVRVMAADAGPRVLTFRVAPRDGEVITQNNRREALLQVVDRSERILYFEGQPRFEMKFLRRAVDGDANLQLLTLVRTAESKYYRFGVDDAEHLAGGFPKTREELFAYRGLALGSIEASAFSADQLRMIGDFVERRGGGLLALGGPKALAEGGYAGTAVADALPVVLDRALRTAAADPSGAPAANHVMVRPTRAGEAHAVTQIAATEEASTRRWAELPSVTTVNPVRTLKPGATMLLAGVDDRRRELVVLASQRYGRGKSIVHTPQDSWRWQMHQSIPLEDQTHENYWRQMLRWVVDGVPDTVDAHAAADRVAPGEPIMLVADVVDRAFVELNDARVVARVRRPGGAVDEVVMPWTGQEDGRYRATVPTAEEGLYTAEVEATRGTTSIGRSVTRVRVAPSDAEYFDAVMQSARLQRIADETGGRFYATATVEGLPQDVQYTGRGVTTTEELELWHLPIVLLTLLSLMTAEWTLRRRVGLP